MKTQSLRQKNTKMIQHKKNTSGGGRSNIAIFLMDKSFKANSIKKEHFILINTTIFQDVRIIKYYVTTIALKFTQ